MTTPGLPDALVDRLRDPDAAEDAAAVLLRHPERLTGVPASGVLDGVTDPRGLTDGRVVELARAWRGTGLVDAVLDLIRRGMWAGTGGEALSAERLRRAAWIIKQVVTSERAAAALDLAVRPAAGASGDAVTRRYLIEGAARAITGEPDAWSRVAGPASVLATDGNPGVREATLALVVDCMLAEETSPDAAIEPAALLTAALIDPDPAVVLVAVDGLLRIPGAQVPENVLNRLSDHAHPGVRRAAAELADRGHTS